jgi:hypothetical protein
VSDTWSLILSVKVFENRLLRRTGVFGLKGNEIIGCRELHNEELHNLYQSPNITRIIKSVKVR